MALMCDTLSGSKSFFTSMKPIDPDKIKEKDQKPMAYQRRHQEPGNRMSEKTYNLSLLT